MLVCEMTAKRNAMLPERYPGADLFVCDILDAVPKGDMGSMEHPLFSLSTKPDMKAREYRNGNTWLTIQPSSHGMATVHDRDVLIYCISQCMAALNSGKKVSRKLSLNAYDLLRATNRQSSGAGNDLLLDALRRLAGTRVETNIQQGGDTNTSNFGLIDGFDVVSKTDNGRIQQLQITLSDWVFDAIDNNNVLTLSPTYFQLRKPIERRLYELARKHCGKQSKWEIGLTKLKDKTGSLSTDKEFKRMLVRVINDTLIHEHMPDYTFELSDHKLVVRPIRSAPTRSYLPPLNSDTYEEARKYAAGWDIRVLESEWRDWVTTKQIKVRNTDTNFISFCKKRGPYKQEELF
jgi:plasmid replication initiation protein